MLELSGARSAPEAAAPAAAAAAAAAGYLGSDTSKLVNQQDVTPASCLMGTGNEKWLNTIS